MALEPNLFILNLLTFADKSTPHMTLSVELVRTEKTNQVRTNQNTQTTSGLPCHIINDLLTL